MADVVNRIVPSSVALDCASWQGRERQRKRDKESGAESLPPDEPVTKQVTGGAGPASEDLQTEKGKHLDISA